MVVIPNDRSDKACSVHTGLVEDAVGWPCQFWDPITLLVSGERCKGDRVPFSVQCLDLNSLCHHLCLGVCLGLSRSNIRS